MNISFGMKYSGSMIYENKDENFTLIHAKMVYYIIQL